MRLVNLTPHSVTIFRPGGETVLPSSGSVARCEQRSQQVEILDGIPISIETFGAVFGLPEPEDGTFYVVSRLVAEAAAREGRQTSDLFLPGPAVRDHSGRVVGCNGLSRLP